MGETVGRGREIEVVLAGEVEPIRAEPFSVRIDPGVLDDLRARIWNARLPERAPGERWEQGTDRDYLEGLLGYWAEVFDWQAQEGH